MREFTSIALIGDWNREQLVVWDGEGAPELECDSKALCMTNRI